MVFSSDLGKLDLPSLSGKFLNAFLIELPTSLIRALYPAPKLFSHPFAPFCHDVWTRIVPFLHLFLLHPEALSYKRLGFSFIENPSYVKSYLSINSKCYRDHCCKRTGKGAVNAWRLSLQSHKILKSLMLTTKLLCNSPWWLRNETEAKRDVQAYLILRGGWEEKKKSRGNVGGAFDRHWFEVELCTGEGDCPGDGGAWSEQEFSSWRMQKNGPCTSEEEKHILNTCMSGRGCSLWVSFEQQGITKEVRKETSVISTVARQLLLIREHSEHKLPSPHSLGGFSSMFPWYNQFLRCAVSGR